MSDSLPDPDDPARLSLLGGMREDISAAMARDPAATSRWVIALTAPGMHALWMHRLAHGCWQRGWRWPGRLLAYIARSVTGVEIHPAARIGRRCFIDHGMGVVIGETAELGDDVLLYHGVTLGGTANTRVKRHPTVGHRVLIGAGAKILGPVMIGDDARIGANAVVLADVPARATATGVPARIRERLPGEAPTRPVDAASLQSPEFWI